MLDLDGLRHNENLHRVAVVADLGYRLRLVTQREIRDVGDGADRLVDPVRVHPRAAADLIRRLDTDGVQQRRVRAVEFDQCPSERTLQRLALQWLGLPRPRDHGADAFHRYDLAQWFIGDGVVLGRRHVHAPVGSAHTHDATVAQRGEELTEDWPDRTGVVEGQFQWRRKGRLGCVNRGRATLADGHAIE